MPQPLLLHSAAPCMYAIPFPPAHVGLNIKAYTPLDRTIYLLYIFLILLIYEGVSGGVRRRSRMRRPRCLPRTQDGPGGAGSPPGGTRPPAKGSRTDGDLKKSPTKSAAPVTGKRRDGAPEGARVLDGERAAHTDRCATRRLVSLASSTLNPPMTWADCRRENEGALVHAAASPRRHPTLRHCLVWRTRPPARRNARTPPPGSGSSPAWSAASAACWLRSAATTNGAARPPARARAAAAASPASRRSPMSADSAPPAVPAWASHGTETP